MRIEPVSATTLHLPPSLITSAPEPDVSSVAIILFGRDERGRPHASRFAGEEAEGAERAAALMDLHHASVDTGALKDLAAQLPAGRLFPTSGKAFVPFCSAKLYQQLLAATGTIAAAMPVKAAGKPAGAGSGAIGGHGSGSGGAGAGGPADSNAHQPGDWAGIKIGSIVLAKGDDEEGYYAAKVVATKADDRVQLIWCGFDLPEFARPRRELGLVHPETAAQMG